jgi:hypothetical protein
MDKKELATSIVKISPFGCVYKPVEECADEESQLLVCGVLSVVGLNCTEVYNIKLLFVKI